MAILTTFLFLFNDQFKPFGRMFAIKTTDDDYIYTLMEKVKESWLNQLTFVPPWELTVWRLSDKAPALDFDDLDAMQHQLGDVFSKEQLRLIRPNEKIANIGVAEGEVLLVQAPKEAIIDAPFGDPVTLTAAVDQKYRHIFLQAIHKGKVVKDDIPLNSIEDVMADDFPEFLESFETKLDRKRMLLDDKMPGVAETVMGATTSKCYFQREQSMADSSEPFPTVGQLEFTHILYISSVDGVKLVKLLASTDEGTKKLFKEADAKWLFFYLFADHLESHPSNITNDGKQKITVKQGQERWPFPLIIQVEDIDHTYRPKSDFLVLKYGLPRLAVEINSVSPGRPALDYHRLMLQGASIVRFANSFLDAYREKKNFIFVAIFISDIGVADRYFMFQKGSSEKVYRKKQSYKFKLKEHRIGFALELYNLFSSLFGESGDEDTKREVDDLKQNLKIKGAKLPTFTGRNSHFASNDGENRPGPSARRGSHVDRQVDQLEACGYEVVSDVLETDRGTWESLSKLPPHIQTVCRRGDSNKTEFIAKHLRERSNERSILEYLHTKQPRSPHVIQFIDATRDWLILPKLHSICNQKFLNSRGLSGRVQLGWGLIRGLAYLHENKIAHRDVKPDNLVCDNKFCLQIIDFDVAIEVQDENTEVGEYRGTKGWTAPEMGTEDGPSVMYSPIKADRWSCGRVIRCHIMAGKEDIRLMKFAHELMAINPQQRPSLLEWGKLFASPFSDVANVVKDGGKEVSRPQQSMVVEVGSMKPPDAKKPRLEQRGELYGSEAFRQKGQVL